MFRKMKKWTNQRNLLVYHQSRCFSSTCFQAPSTPPAEIQCIIRFQSAEYFTSMINLKTCLAALPNECPVLSQSFPYHDFISCSERSVMLYGRHYRAGSLLPITKPMLPTHLDTGYLKYNSLPLGTFLCRHGSS